MDSSNTSDPAPPAEKLRDAAAFTRGAMFTTEPMVVRALAAELRHNPQRASRILSEAVKAELAPLTGIRCESSDHANLDIVATCGDATVGIEAKIGHVATEEQLRLEAATVTHLILLVKDAGDAPETALGSKLAVTTWQTMLAQLPDSRVTIADVNALQDGKRIARAALKALDLTGLPADWARDRNDGNSGAPSLSLYAPDNADGPQITVQIETDRAHQGVLYLANVGVRVTAQDFASVPAVEPDWVSGARHIGNFLEPRLADTAAQLSSNAGQGRAGTPSEVKVATAEKFGLPLNYATGYTDSYVGVRTLKVSADKLAGMVSALIPAIIALAQSSTQGS